MTLGILRSQVGIPLKRLGESGYRFILTSPERLGDFFKSGKRKKIRQELLSNGVSVIFIPKFLPKYLQVVPSWIRKGTFLLPFLLDVVIFTLLAFFIVAAKRVKIIHARSYVPAAVGVAIKKIFGVKLIFDPRGIIPEELQLARGWKDGDFRVRLWKNIEKRILKNSDIVFALSTPFKEHLQKISPQSRILITPCSVDSSYFIYDPHKRASLRKKMNITEQFIVLYSVGCFVPYQITEDATRIFALIKEIKPNARLWICTPDAVAIKKCFSKNNLLNDDIRIFSAGFEEMPDVNLAADLGLMIRHSSIVSEVASPVKFAEYLSCGLPVASYPHIGDTEEIIESYKTGCIIYPDRAEESKKNLTALFAMLDSEPSALKQRCADTAKKSLSLESVIEIYKDVYNTL